MANSSAHNPFTFTSTAGRGGGGGGGRNAHIFQPPKSPATVSTTPSTVTATTSDCFGPASRKRSRADSSQAAASWSATPSWVHCPTPGDASYTGNTFGQQLVPVNDKYRLAGGYDTPSLQAAQDMERMCISEEDLTRRRVRDGSLDLDAQPQNAHAVVTGPLARERNGVGRLSTLQNGSPSTWTGLAFTLVGKVFQFGTSMVRGFYAGEGRGFEFTHSPRSDLFASNLEKDFGCSTPVPGSWRDDDFLGDFEQDNKSSPTARSTNKRRQVDRETWVMVGTPDLTDNSPRRKHPSNMMPRSSLAGGRPQASRASSRRSMAPALRRQTSHINYAGSPVPLPTFDTTRRASFAPMRSPHSRRGSGDLDANAYVSPEVERYAKRQAKQDRAADKTMSSMSRRLEDLIRQGQEALGTKISVDLETDEGFVDEEW